MSKERDRLELAYEIVNNIVLKNKGWYIDKKAVIDLIIEAMNDRDYNASMQDDLRKENLALHAEVRQRIKNYNDVAEQLQELHKRLRQLESS